MRRGPLEGERALPLRGECALHFHRPSSLVAELQRHIRIAATLTCQPNWIIDSPHVLRFRAAITSTVSKVCGSGSPDTLLERSKSPKRSLTQSCGERSLGAAWVPVGRWRSRWRVRWWRSLMLRPAAECTTRAWLCPGASLQCSSRF